MSKEAMAQKGEFEKRRGEERRVGGTATPILWKGCCKL
jgi:hypothetical protein